MMQFVGSVLHVYGGTRDERFFLRIDPSGTVESQACLLKARAAAVVWEPDGEHAWMTVERRGVFRVPTSLRAGLAWASFAADAAVLGLDDDQRG